MAFSGLHVVIEQAATVSQAGGPVLYSTAYASETIASGATTSTAVVPPNAPANTIVSLYASADGYVAIGPSPDPTQTASASKNTIRRLIPAQTLVEIAGVQAGDKVAWLAA